MSFVRGPKDFYAGLLFIGVGIFTIVVAANYPMGTAARMGPGYFPRALGSLLIILGFFSLVRGLRTPGEPIPRWFFRPIIVALGSVVIFGLIVQIVGMALSTVFLVAASSAASPEFRIKESIVAGVLMAIACVAVFIYGLGITLPVWPQFS
jgi:hypothetical protein